MIIREARPEDVGAVAALERSAPEAAHWSSLAYQQIFAGSPPRLFLVAEDEKGMAGFLVASTASPEWELENLAVAQDRRRQGIARRLLEELLARARRQEADAVWLEVRASNATARRLYQACGFSLRGTRKSYYSNPLEDAVLLTISLQKPRRK